MHQNTKRTVNEDVQLRLEKLQASLDLSLAFSIGVAAKGAL